MAKKQPKVKQQEEHYEHFLTCSSEDLESWYNSYVTGYPRHVAPMIKAIATLRNIDTANWQPFYV